VFLRIK